MLITVLIPQYWGQYLVVKLERDRVFAVNKHGQARTEGRRVSQLKPAQILVLGFAFLILVGSILLTLPISAREGRLPYLDALFTATSAVCVTGLVVVDTGTFFSSFGQFVIMLLIQFGGLGLMTMATFVALIIGKRITLRERILIQEALNTYTLEGLVRLTKYIVITTFTIESIAAVVLSLRFLSLYGFPKNVWMGIFHAVSAFCNAGFDLFGNFTSLTSFTEDIVVNVVVILLIILGGIGFSVLADVYYERKFTRFSLHTKVALTLTLALLVFGAISFFALEYANPETMAPLSLKGKMLASFFLSTTPRTAGFNTVDTASLTTASAFLVIILMFIGASPGGTGGGVKTTTMGALAMSVIAVVRGKDDANMFGRRLTSDIIYKALAIVMISLTLVIVVTTILSITEEEASFLEILFEATSAFGTVGLSMGITGSLSAIGKVVIIITMFAGRVGPLTLAIAFAEKHEHAAIRYPEERIIVG